MVGGSMALDTNKTVLRFEVEVIVQEVVYLTDEDYENYINNEEENGDDE